MIYEELFKAFEEKGVRYLVVGGVAVNLYGYLRMTMDLDIMVDLSDENLLMIVEVMEILGYAPRVPVMPHELISRENRDRWIKEKGAVVFTFINLKSPFKQVDIFLNNPIDFEGAFLRRHTMEISGVMLSIASVQDLITTKRHANRPRDLEDIEHLQRTAALRRT